MATIIQAEISASEFALSETLNTCSDVTVECEQFVSQPDDKVLPLVWVRTTTPERFEAALDQDDTVGSYTRIAGTETEWLYEMSWNGNIKLIVQMLTTEGAVILDTRGSSEGWHLRVLFPERDNIRTTLDFCSTHNLSIDIHTIRNFDDGDADQGSIRAGLTAAQYEALSLAYQRGYFSVPRAIDLESLADEVGVSHQALSERLRRGHATLIGETLMNGTTQQTSNHSTDITANNDESDMEPVDD